MDNYDYSTELISKWLSVGHLNDVMECNWLDVARRLEGAYRRSLGSQGDPAAMQEELYRLKREGYIRSHVEIARSDRPKRRRSRSRQHQVRA
jgi:hypothetical protein